MYRRGDHLVTTGDGDVIYASQSAVERYGVRRGLLVHRDDLEQPGKSDLPQFIRTPGKVEPVTDQDTKTRQTYNSSGLPTDPDGTVQEPFRN